MQKDSRALVLGIVIIVIIGYHFLPNLFQADPTIAPTSLNNINLPSTYDPNALNSSNSSSQVFPSVNNTMNIGSGNNALTSGYMVLFVSNGISQQLSVNAQDYAFLQELFQSDNNGIGASTVFLVDNGQMQQYNVSKETYSIISNMATIKARTSNTSTSSTPPTTMLPTTAISETLTVSNPSTTGFTVTLNPALSGLTTSNFTLVNSSGNPITLTGAATSDNGATYAISAALSAGQTYTLTDADAGYTFGAAQNVTVASTGYIIGTAPNSVMPAAISVTLTVSNPSTSGFTVTLNPALSGLTTSNFTLVNSSGTPVVLTGTTTSVGGATYAISAVLSAGQTYTLTAVDAGYTFGTAQNVVVPL